MKKRFVTANELLEDAFTLALHVLDSGFTPDLIIGLWRGGTPVAVAIHEALCVTGLSPAHLPIKTSSYQGIGERNHHVEISGLEQLQALRTRPGNVLIVDDVFDTGNTMNAVLNALTEQTTLTDATIKILTPWWKPEVNQTSIAPDYWLHQTNDWIVFPHEMAGLSEDELSQKPGAGAIVEWLRMRKFRESR